MAYVVDAYGRNLDYSYNTPRTSTPPRTSQNNLTASNISVRQPTLMSGDRDPVTGITTFSEVNPYNKPDTGNLNYQYDPQAQAALIASLFNSRLGEQIGNIKKAYDQARGDYSSAIPQIGQYADQAKSQNDAMYYTQALPEIRAAYEQAGGYRGGEMANQNVNALSTRMQNASNIDMEKVNQLSAIQQALAQLNSQQAQDEANATNTLDAQKISAQLQGIGDTFNRSMSYANTYGKNPITGQSTVATQDKERSAYVGTINRFYDNFQGEYDNVANDGDTSNDWQLPYLQAARQEKIASQNAEKRATEQAASVAQNTEAKQRYDRAMQLWKEQGIASAEVAQALGIPVGSKTESYLKMQYETGKPYYNPNTSSSSGMSSTERTEARNTYKRVFENAIANGDYEKARAMVMDDEQGVKDDLGTDLWQELYNKLWAWQKTK